MPIEGFDVASYTNKMVDMFTSESSKEVTLLCENELMRVIIDHYGEDAAVVKMYYVDAKPWFVYNETDGLYYRYEFGDKQIDGSTGEQLAVKNIILQNCYSSLKDSKNGTLDIDYLSGGSGMYITNGKAVPITWKRASANDITHYYTQDGQEIILNPGKTWVEIVENSRASQNKISAE